MMLMMTIVVPGAVQSTSHEWLNLINTTEESGMINFPIVQKREFLWDIELAQGHTALTPWSWVITTYFKLLTHNNHMVLAQE